MNCELLCNQLYTIYKNGRNFAIMLKFVPIDEIGLSCVVLEMLRTFLMILLAWNKCIMCTFFVKQLDHFIKLSSTYFRYLGYVITYMHWPVLFKTEHRE
jgi:hypothetical protein